MDITGGLPPNQSVRGLFLVPYLSISFVFVDPNVRSTPFTPQVIASGVSPLLVVIGCSALVACSWVLAGLTVVTQLNSPAPAVLLPLTPWRGISGVVLFWLTRSSRFTLALTPIGGL